MTFQVGFLGLHLFKISGIVTLKSGENYGFIRKTFFFFLVMLQLLYLGQQPRLWAKLLFNRFCSGLATVRTVRAGSKNRRSPSMHHKKNLKNYESKLPRPLFTNLCSDYLEFFFQFRQGDPWFILTVLAADYIEIIM